MAGNQIKLAVGEVIQGYRIEGELGAGGFGVVYEGYHDVLERKAAIKEFYPETIARRRDDGVIEAISDPEWYQSTLKKFIATTRALSQLEHPNIVRVHGFENKNGTAYMIMDLVRGRTLRGWRETTDEPITEAMARRIFTPVLDALAYMHQRGMLHRDISPDNVMLDGRGRAVDSFSVPMLIDFGALKDESPREGTRSVSAPVYHPVFSPPEQSDTSGGSTLTPASEVYSVAATMYAFILGAPPEAATSRASKISLGGGDPYRSLISVFSEGVQSLPGDVSERFVAAIDAGLSMRPGDRPQSIEAFALALGWPLDGSDEGVTAVAPERPAPQVQPPQAPQDGGWRDDAPKGFVLDDALARRERRDGGVFRRYPALQYLAVLLIAGVLVGAVMMGARFAPGGDTIISGFIPEDRALEVAQARVARAVDDAERDLERAEVDLPADAVADFRERIAALAADGVALRDPDGAGSVIDDIRAVEDAIDEARRDAQGVEDEAEEEMQAKRRARRELRGLLEEIAPSLETFDPPEALRREHGSLLADLRALRGALERPAERFDEDEVDRRRDEIDALAAAIGALIDESGEAMRVDALTDVEALSRELSALDAPSTLEDEADDLASDVEDLRDRLARLEGRMEVGDAPEIIEEIAGLRDRIADLRDRASEVSEDFAAQFGPGEVFRECADCPLMVVIEGDRFTLGAGGVFGLRDVEIETFALAVAEVARDDFQRFIDATGRRIGDDCDSGTAGGPRSWLEPGFAQTGSHPVVCVSYFDAEAYVVWLNSQVDGSPYRLASEAEFEFALRADASAGRYPWGSSLTRACDFANIADIAALGRFEGWDTVDCDDRFVFTAPIGGFDRSSLGLHDLTGNVSEWTADCWNPSHVGGPTDGSFRFSGDCARAVVRGGSWSTVPDSLLATDRGSDERSMRFSDLGFRVARSIE